MEEKKSNKYNCFDYLATALSIITGMTITEQLGIKGELLRWCVMVGIIVAVEISLYIIKYVIADKRSD